MTAMTELVVPRSIPTVFGISLMFLQAADTARLQILFAVDLLPRHTTIKTSRLARFPSPTRG
jgi:hypothetical protein